MYFEWNRFSKEKWMSEDNQADPIQLREGTTKKRGLTHARQPPYLYWE